MRKLALNGKHGKGKFALVDDEDYDYLNQWKWNISSVGYVSRNEWIDDTSVKILIHRVITSTNNKNVVDHKNHDKLDNRKENLRVCTSSQNVMNQQLSKRNKLGVKGIVWYEKRQKYAVYVKVGKKTKFGGYHSTLDDAKLAYNSLATQHYGEFAYLPGA